MSRPRTKRLPPAPPQSGWAVYLRTSSDENQKPEMSRARQRLIIEGNVLEHSPMPVYDEYIDVLTGKTPNRDAYQRMLADARLGKFSHVIVERADRFGRNDTEALRAIDELWGFGVAVRFASQPDLDPQDPDDRVIVTLQFTLARRESAMLGIRVVGGLQAKRNIGGYCGIAPDGYLNKEEAITGQEKKLQGRRAHWIELDSERAHIWRMAWDLLLNKGMTVEEICEALHARGYTYKSGRPFVETKQGRRRANAGTLWSIFHNWTYAGWLTSKKNKIPEKTIRGSWEPLVTTEELERGIAIIAERDNQRGRKRQHDYLLRGLVYYRAPEGQVTRLTCSTSNASRSGGGTSYYCIARSDINFQCDEIDGQIAEKLHAIQIAPERLPAIRAAYTQDVAEALGHIKPDDREQLQRALKLIDDEETRSLRLYAAGKISEPIWDQMWHEWQDRRAKIRITLEAADQQQHTYITNLDAALEMIAKIGLVYNALQRSDQSELLRHVVERVVIDPDGQVKLELRSPFAYLNDLSVQAAEQDTAAAPNAGGKAKAGRKKTGSGSGTCSDKILLCGENKASFEHLRRRNTSEYLHHITFPQRMSFMRFMTTAS